MRKFLRSRGARKFRQNRMAMASLVVIVAYVLLSGWIAGVNTVNDFVKAEGNVGVLEGRPILGLFLRSATREEVGPAEMPGFGLAPSAQDRVNIAQFKIAKAGQAISTAERAGEGADLSVILREGAVGARPLAELPVPELRAIWTAASTEFEQIVSVRRQIGSAQGIRRLADGLAERRAELEAVLAQPEPDEDRLFIATDELVLTLEEFVEEAERLQAGAPDEEIAAAMDPSALAQAAEALLDAEDLRGVDPYPAAAVSRVVEAAERAVPRLEEKIDEALDGMQSELDALYPELEGVEGAITDFKLWLGTDKQGRSILVRSLYSAKIAVQVGVVTALIAVAFGSVLGAAAAFFGGWVDHATNWLYSMIISIPYLVLLAVLAFLFLGSAWDGTLVPLYVAFGLTFWTGPYRVIRGETLKIKELEYVQAATAIGFGRIYILLKHILPNTVHLMFINFSLLFIGAIKGEVILTFLGLGLKDGASWGIMISHAAEQVVSGFFWQIGAATFFMFVLVLAFNIFTDALQDAFDPKHVS